MGQGDQGGEHSAAVAPPHLASACSGGSVASASPMRRGNSCWAAVSLSVARQRFGDGQRLAQRCPRPRRVDDGAQLVETDDEIDLPADVARIGGKELARDAQAFLVGGQAPAPGRRLASRSVADLVEADAQVALPAGIARIGGGELAT